MSNTFLDIIASRHCKRAFLDKLVPTDLLETVLNAAQQAPSSKNTQSWQATVVRGTKLNELSDALCEQFDRGEPAKADYEYMSEPMDDIYKERARATGHRLFELKGIGRKDFEGRKAHGRENFTFFGAPIQMIFHLPSNAQPGMFLDMGLYMQTVMLGLTAVGLGSCPQFSIASYPDAIRSCLGLSSDRIIASGMSIGYVDETAKINGFIPERLPLEAVISWQE